VVILPFKEPSPFFVTGESSAGLLQIREFDESFGLRCTFAALLDDCRDAELVSHSFLQMARSRAYGKREELRETFRTAAARTARDSTRPKKIAPCAARSATIQCLM
jgi:hypothetical protein